MIHLPQTEPLDLIAIERQARAMQSRAMAEGLRNLFAWLRGRLTWGIPVRTA